MGANWYDYNVQYTQQHLDEMRAAAARARLARRARRAHPLRRQVGVLLIAAGEALSR